ncbi:receptor-type tyrosine-protein phosphatase alpha-like [Physella acuta]|uniref:receptor-type tyrosine-protein phosphatase alpha-like n=1 Tax=Physella acuta TaxID=109671 RepID=UPI0027DD70A2|nr:receptor-type tyrosine-protein phosphatase alpha-like [Physella acuta]
MYLLFAVPIIIILIVIIIIFLLRKMKQIQTEPYAAPVEKPVVSTSVPISQLKTHIMGHNTNFFLTQFKSIPTVYIGEKTEKKDTAATYDHSFIRVTPWPPQRPANFFTPSFLALSKEKLIATQDPVAETTVGFLNLLWDKEVVKIAMISTEKTDNEDSYWSHKNKKIDCYTLKTVKTEVFTDYTIRTLDIIKDDNPPRQLTHFQYTAWPEDGSDPCLWSLVEFEHKVFLNTLEEVTLVHCQSSVNRSSLFIALHDLIRQAKLNHSVDFVETVSRLRQDRPNMVASFEQYMFLHHAAQAGIACTGSYTHISAIFLKVHLMGSVVNGKTNFETEFKNLFSVEIKFTAGDGDVTQDPKSKDRFNIIPDKKYQPVLQVESREETAYINAVILPSLITQPKQFLTQLPMPTTVNDFWRLVTQYNVSLIVAFKSYEKDKVGV